MAGSGKLDLVSPPVCRPGRENLHLARYSLPGPPAPSAALPSRFRDKTILLLQNVPEGNGWVNKDRILLKDILYDNIVLFIFPVHGSYVEGDVGSKGYF